MKNIVLVAVVVASVAVFSCTQILPPSSSGRDFPSANVSKIVRGKTTDKDLIQMLGEPLSKTVISETEKSWIYTYTSGTATVVRRLTSVETKYEGNAKTLDIIGKENFSGGLYFNPRPYYYFEIHKDGHNAFLNFVKNKKTFHVKADLSNKIVHIE